MKKLLFAFCLISLVALTGCTNPSNNQTGSGDYITGEQVNIVDYSGELVVTGIGPDVSFEPTVESDILVLKKTYEDHSDHIFFSRMFWDNYLDIFEDCIPGNIVKFDGKVKALDVAAGNHYYEVVETNTLEKIGIPNKEDILSLLDRYNHCEEDGDCATLYGKCPLPCHIAVNTQFSGVVENIVDNFWNNQESQCMYKCMEIQSVKCDNYKCVIN